LDVKSESGPSVYLRLHADRPIELVYDHFRDAQPEAHHTPVEVLGGCDTAEELEELLISSTLIPMPVSETVVLRMGFFVMAPYNPE
jgi:hypothetical protein